MAAAVVVAAAVVMVEAAADRDVTLVILVATAYQTVWAHTALANRR